MMRLILASASPRRSQLLKQAELDFEVMPSGVEESVTGDTPEAMVQALAAQKAEDIFRRVTEGMGPEDEPVCVIGADTIVAFDDQRLGKPADEADAFHMLMMLSGRTHQVHTGVCLIAGTPGRVVRTQFAATTDVMMYPFGEDLAHWYVSTGEPMDKAGAYGIQGKGAVLVEQIRGDYYNVVGLPLAAVWHAIRSIREQIGA